MARSDIHLTGVERTFGTDEIIVSKTDPKGRIIYANEVFLHLAGYTEREIIGQPHSLIRHPAMPRCVFKLLWDTIQSGKECFAYVLNRSKNGDHYWVLAHVTPNLDAKGTIIGFHSSRRAPRAEALAKVKPLYQTLLETERKAADRKIGQEASYRQLTELLAREGKSYGEFVFGL